MERKGPSYRLAVARKRGRAISRAYYRGKRPRFSAQKPFRMSSGFIYPRQKNGYTTGVPPVFRQKLKSSCVGASALGTATFGAFTITPNSANDPYGGFGATQAATYDAFKNVWNRSYVTFAKFRLVITNTAAVPVHVGIFNSNQSTVKTTWPDCSTQPGFKYVSLPPADNAGDSKVLTWTVPIRSILGMAAMDASSTGASGANPTSLAYTHVCIYSADQASNLDTEIKFSFEGVQWCTWTISEPVIDA